MATIVTRAGKGSPLTNTEVDANFTNLNADKLEGQIGTAPDEVPVNGLLGGMAYQSPESVVIKPQATAVPNGVGDMIFQATSNSVIEMEYKGSDAVVRTAQIPLSNERLAELSRVNPLAQAVRVAMTAATSGSNGIIVLNNTNVNMGTNDFTLHWQGALPDWTPSGFAALINKRSGSFPSTAIGYQLFFSSGVLIFQLMNGAAGLSISRAFTYSFAGFAAFSHNSLDVVVDRMSSIQLFVNGLLVETVDTTATDNGATITDTTNLAISGDYASRTASDTQQAIIYNRALSAAEVLSLCVNGPALVDFGGSQTNAVTNPDAEGGVTTGWAANTTGGTIAANAVAPISGTYDFLVTSAAANYGVRTNVLSMVTGAKYRLQFKYSAAAGNWNVRVNNGNAYNNTAGYGPTALTEDGTVQTFSVEFTASGGGADLHFYDTSAGSTILYLDDVSFVRIGITGLWNAANAQSNTGQIFDSSGNGNHALLPAAGATIIGRPTSQPQQVRWTNTWNNTQELQYIGGVNQAILPANAYIESIVVRVTGTHIHDITVGDGVDADRYVVISGGGSGHGGIALGVGTFNLPLANQTTDGTNLKLTVDPDTDCTMTIVFTITYTTLE